MVPHNMKHIVTIEYYTITAFLCIQVLCHGLIVCEWQKWHATLAADGRDASLAQERWQMAEHSFPLLTVQVDAQDVVVVVVEPNDDDFLTAYCPSGDVQVILFGIIGISDVIQVVVNRAGLPFKFLSAVKIINFDCVFS